MAHPLAAEMSKLLAPYDTVALVLQGGGALGAYQGGVIEGLVEAGIVPNRIAGISIGALNAAILAGNPPERWIERLRGFWETICRHPFFPQWPSAPFAPGSLPLEMQKWLGVAEAWRAIFEGQDGFFLPRGIGGVSHAADDPSGASFYDTSPLRDTLERFVDFDRINARERRVSVGAVNVANGNFVYFDNWKRKLRPEHFMASGALPPGFPAVEIDGQFFWDGGLVSNTPLAEVTSTDDDWQRTLVFQVDLWSASGELPRDLTQVALRQKDIQFSSRTRLVTGMIAERNERAATIRELLELVPPEVRATSPVCRRLSETARDRRLNIVHLIYKDKPAEGHYKDYQFSLATMRDHWAFGLADMHGTLALEDWLAVPPQDAPTATHDLHRRVAKD
jgi:NTE family protein